MITTTITRFPNYLGKGSRYEMFTAENSNTLYAVNGAIVTKEEGNQMFRDAETKYGKAEVERESKPASNVDILNYFDSKIDHYTCYIEDYNQMKAAEARNQVWEKLKAEFRKIMT